jgi:hypothetical protein
MIMLETLHHLKKVRQLMITNEIICLFEMIAIQTSA